MKRRARLNAMVLVRVLAWLVVGAVINVAVAWGAVRGCDDYQLWSVSNSMVPRGIVTEDPFSAPPTSWPFPVPETWPAPGVQWKAHAACWTEVWVCSTMNFPYPLHTASRQLFGWPCRALQDDCWTETRGANIASSYPGTAIRSPWVGKCLGVSCLPLRPVWPGFTLNTLFYAGIAWGLWQVPLALRRRSRNKKGLCVRCGYDLKGIGEGAVCPECGSVPLSRK